MDAVRRWARRYAWDAFAAVLFAGMAVAWWWPLPLHLTTGQLENPPIDPAFNQWILGWGVHALTTDPLALFDANMFHPFDDVLAWGDHLFGLTIFAVPLVPVLGVLGTYNAFLLATSAVSGFTAYKLAAEVSGDKATGVLAGIMWAFSAARLREATHIQVLATQWIPLVFLFAERWCASGRRPRHLVLLALATWLVLVTNVYLAMYTALAFGVWALVGLAVRHIEWRRAPGLAAAWAVACVAAVPLYLPGLRVRSRMDVHRGLDDQLSAQLDALLPLPLPGRPAQAAFGDVVAAQWRYTTLGLLTIALIVVAIGFAVKRRSVAPLRRHLPYLAVGLVGVVSAQGPSFKFNDVELASNPVFLAAYHLVPGYDALRVPARWFLVIGIFGLAVFAVAGARPVLDRLARRAAALPVAAIALASAVVLFEQAPAPSVVTETYRLDDYPVYEWLADQPGDSVILELPISADLASLVTQAMEAKRMYLSTFHWKRRVNGAVSPVIDPRYAPPAVALDRLGTDVAALDILERYEVRYVVVVDEDFAAYGRTDAEAVRNRLDGLRALERVRDFPGATVFETSFAAP